MIYVVVPNFNGKEIIGDCLRSLAGQTQKHEVIVVDDGSTDDSVAYIESRFPGVKILVLGKNRGFASAVNAGITEALKNGANYIALLNNDAKADKNWLKRLVAAAAQNPKVGITTGKFLLQNPKNKIDSTGDIYSTWGFSIPRGRDEIDNGQYDQPAEVFGGSGGASLYNAKLFRDIGLFDEDFFFYYEDYDLSFRAQLAGWRVIYEPKAVAYHKLGATASKLGEFTRYHTLKNFYYLYLKNMPGWLFWKYLPQFGISQLSLVAYNIRKGLWRSLIKAEFVVIVMFVPMLIKRWKIQSRRKVSTEYIDSILYHGVPANQRSLHRLVSRFKRQ